MDRKPTNTTQKLKQPEEIFRFLAEQLEKIEQGESPNSAIPDMEAAGQRELLFSDVLPTDMSRNTKEEFEDLGFILGDVIEDDPIFRYAVLPEGWTKKPAGNSFWSVIVDTDDMERVGIFYKAAFYDRHSHMFIVKEPVKYEGG